MKILLTNDDGIDAEGLHTMARAVSGWIDQGAPGERSAVVVAPHINYSGYSSAVGDVFEHSVVPFERRSIAGAENIDVYCFEAPPALCSIIGCLGGVSERPDVVLSGINPGANVGRSVLHSGTVGAVLTAAQLGISGLAVSVQWGDLVHYDTAAILALEVLEELLLAPSPTSLNLNVPNVAAPMLRGVRRARISTAEVIASVDLVTPTADGVRGAIQLYFGAATPSVGDVSDEADDDDGALVESGFASLSALQGPRENNDAALDVVMRASLARLSAHLDATR
jgi:5'-nucleotidase